MKLLRVVPMMALLVACIPASQVYGMDAIFTALGLTIKKSEEPAVFDYKISLDTEIEFSTEAWKQFPDELHARAMAKSYWIRSRFHELSKLYVFAHAKETLEYEINAQKYKENKQYQVWVWDKTLIGGESIPCPYLT